MSHETPQEAGMEAPQEGGITRWVENQVRNTPWWMISIAFHLIVLAGMTVITFKEEVREMTVAALTPVHHDLPKIEVERPTDIVGSKSARPDSASATRSDNNQPVLDDCMDFPEAKVNISDNGIDGDTMLGQSESGLSADWGEGHGIGRGMGGPGSNKTMGTGGGGGGALRFGNGKGGRGEFRKRDRNGAHDGTVAENAVTHGLWWLARHQESNGAWSSAAFDHNCAAGKCDGPGYNDYDAGVTGLSVLAFLGVGYTHLSKETYVDPVTKKKICYGDVVRSGIKWLLASQDAEGCFGGRHGSKYMYNHAIAALAMAEAYGLTDSPIFKDAAQRGIDFLCEAQMPYKAWRYSKRCEDNDTSVTGWAVMALKSADIAKLVVPRSAFEGAKAWILECTDESYYRTGYTAKGTGKVVVQGKNEDFEDHPSLTAVGMLCRTFIDHNQKDPALDGGAKLMMADTPVYGGKKTDYYYWYYGSLALFQWDGPDGKFFQAWNQSMTNALIPSQHGMKDGCAFGSWDVNVDRWGFEGGRVYTTAINTLNLEVYYRYASVFGGKRGK
ncbi:MAG: hypothetical protein K8T20_15800 [Planctomycetes bacterium]|nr:hypothetical protein [Planctomycetota bacterium]